MAKLYSYFTDAALFAILTVIGIVVSVVLFVLFCRNRKQDRMTRRRFLRPLVLLLIHTLLTPLAFMLESDILSLPWFCLVPVLLVVQILYLVHFKNGTIMICGSPQPHLHSITSFSFSSRFSYFLFFCYIVPLSDARKHNTEQ